MKHHGKGVRDGQLGHRAGVPAIIRASGTAPTLRVLDDDEYLSTLGAKLVEEALEAQQSVDQDLLEELGDVLEVVRAIAMARGWQMTDVGRATTKSPWIEVQSRSDNGWTTQSDSQTCSLGMQPHRDTASKLKLNCCGYTTASPSPTTTPSRQWPSWAWSAA